MAEKEPKKKRRVVKKTQTVRERATEAAEARPQPRRIRRTVSTAQKPFQATGRGIARILSPLSFLLIPFKTRPARFIGRFLATILFLRYFKNSWIELRQVAWPDRRNTAKLTLAVFVFAILFGLLVAVVDYCLDKVFKSLLLN